MALTYLYDETGVNCYKKPKGKDKGYYNTDEHYYNSNGLDNEGDVMNKDKYNNKDKDKEIFSLRNEVYSLQSALKMKECKFNEYKDKLKKVMQQFKTREGELLALNKTNERKLNEITNEYNEYIREHQLTNNTMGRDIDENNEEKKTIRVMQSTISELKKENKQIAYLNSVLYQKDETINDLKNQLDEMQNYLKQSQSQGKQVIGNNDHNKNSKFKLGLFNQNTNANIFDPSSDRVNQATIRDNNDMSYLQNSFRIQLEQKDSLYNDLNTKYNTVIKDNEEIIQFTLSQINSIEESLNQPDAYSTSNINQSSNETNIKIKHQSNLQYDLIAKTFDILNSKIKDKLSVMNQYRLYLSEENNTNTNNKCLINQLTNDKDTLEQKINQLTKELKDKADSFDEMDKKYNELFSRCIKIEERLNTSNDNYTQFKAETEEFCNSCLRVIHNYLSIDSSNELIQGYQNIKEKEDNILESLSVLCHSIPPSFESLKQNDDMKHNSNEPLKDEDLALNTKQEEEEELLNKIQALTAQLEESNRLLMNSEEEIELMKNRNNKLEHNLVMLSQSHSEIENAIASNSEYFKELISEKEIRNDNLLKENELKDIQIHSLEKLLKEIRQVNGNAYANSSFNPNGNCLNRNNSNQNNALNQMKGKLVFKSQINAMKLGNTSNNTMRDTIFIPNEENEKELKTIFQNFDNESNTQRSDHFNYNSNDSINVNKQYIPNDNNNPDTLRQSSMSNIHNYVKP